MSFTFNFFFYISSLLQFCRLLSITCVIYGFRSPYLYFSNQLSVSSFYPLLFLEKPQLHHHFTVCAISFLCFFPTYFNILHPAIFIAMQKASHEISTKLVKKNLQNKRQIAKDGFFPWQPIIKCLLL